MVFTKFDVFKGQTRVTIANNHPGEDQTSLDILVEKEIERKLQDEYLKPLRNITGNDKFPHAVVSGEGPLGS